MENLDFLRLIFSCFVVGEIVLAYGAVSWSVVSAAIAVTAARSVSKLVWIALAAIAAALAVCAAVYGGMRYEDHQHVGYNTCINSAAGPAADVVQDIRSDLAPFVPFSLALNSARDDFISYATTLNTEAQLLLVLACSLKFSILPAFFAAASSTDAEIQSIREYLKEAVTRSGSCWTAYEALMEEKLSGEIVATQEVVIAELACASLTARCTGDRWPGQYDVESLHAMNATLYHAAHSARTLLAGYTDSAGRPCMATDIQKVAQAWQAAQSCLGDDTMGTLQRMACEAKVKDLKTAWKGWEIWMK